MDLPQRTRRMRRGEWENGRVGDLFAHCLSRSPRLPVSHSFSLRVLCVLCGYFFLPSDSLNASAQDVVLVEGAGFRGELVSIDAGGNATFRVADAKRDEGSTREVALNQLV